MARRPLATRIRRTPGWKISGAAVLGLVGCRSVEFADPAPPGPKPVPLLVAFEPASPAGQETPDEGIVLAGATETDDPAPPEPPARKKKATEKEADPSYKPARQIAQPAAGQATPVIPPPEADVALSLGKALELAGVENPRIGLAEVAVQNGEALQLQAQALLLPNLRFGGNYRLHDGTLLSPTGIVRKVDIDSFYFGAGAGASGSNTVAFPGVQLFAHLGDAYFEPKVARQVVANRRYQALATRNDVLLDVARRYLALLEAEAGLALVHQSQADFAEIVRLTANFLEAGAGNQADADRARTDSLLLEGEERRAQEAVAVASAELAQLLNLNPAKRIRTGEIPIQVVQLVDPKIPLPNLLETAVAGRPEMQAAAAALAAATVRVREEKVRPFLPVLSVGYSFGDFGGGGTQNSQILGQFSGRSDFDALAVWTLQNVGVGNLARVKGRRAELREAEAERLRTLNRITEEVSDAYNLSAARFLEMDSARRQVQSGVDAVEHDVLRARNGRGRPIEVLTSVKQLLDGRRRLLRAIMGYDEAQFRLFVALGQPPNLAAAVPDAPPAAPPETVAQGGAR